MSESIKVDIWSDVACPWCYIGKRKLETAIAQYAAEPGSAPIEVEYHSYLLNPDMPVDFEGSQTEYLSQHKGVEVAQVQQMTERITQIAKDVGLNYNFAGMKMTNTVLAHQLLHYAKAHGKQVEMKERIMAAHFVEARHVGRIAELADLGAEIGLDRADVVRSLEAGEYLEDFNQDVAAAREYGITGVPFFVIDNKYGVSGAQDPSVFVNAFHTIVEERTQGTD